MDPKPCTPEAPLIVEGGIFPGDVQLMLRCLFEELLRGGVTLHEIDAMARDSGFQALFAARETLGAAPFDALLTRAAARVGVHSCRIRETPQTTFEAALTIHGAAQAGDRPNDVEFGKYPPFREFP